MLPAAIDAASALLLFVSSVVSGIITVAIPLMLPRDRFLSVSSTCHMQSWDGGTWHGITSALAIIVASICFTGCLRFTSHLCTDPGTFTGLQHHVGAVIAFVLPLSLRELGLCAFVSPVVSGWFGRHDCNRCSVPHAFAAIVAAFHCCLFPRLSPDYRPRCPSRPSHTRLRSAGSASTLTSR
jgi:hypothetical protein